MFIKFLKITKGSTIIRDIKFRKGINLIVDDSVGKITGNNVGKTTVLKLVDYCLGANKNIIWADPENKKHAYTLVKDYLIDNNVLVTLCLTDNLEDEKAQDIMIERNFISRGKEVIRRINGENYSLESFEPKLKEIFFPEHKAEKPTFRQIISHNIRYDDLSLTNTLKTLDRYTSNAEYETLYLFLLGCDFTKGNSKQEILEKIKQENKFKDRLVRNRSKPEYEATLALIERDIKELDKKKASLNLNPNFENDLDLLNTVKYSINKVSSEISNLNIRKSLILEAKQDLEKGTSDVDLRQLRMIYDQASLNLGELHKSFEELVHYHNQMITEKVKYITNELPQIDSKIAEKMHELDLLLKDEETLTSIVSKSDTYEELEKIISETNEKYRLKGEYEKTVEQLNEVEHNLEEYNDILQSIDDELFSDEFEDKVKLQVHKFNTYFATVSELLYGEKYALAYDITEYKGQRLYVFSTFVPYGPNLASGKKQGEISSFDIAYTLFADEGNIPCMHFILNDKKELMHDNQLIKIADCVNHSNVQFVASILKDKLPEELNKEEYFIVELSEDDKLFRIENEI
ncbi:MAG: DUF2326 domain-containing protein [Methanolobus sp.]|nr:DUF2326 domain-containing protein [Methanolobus sp.]